MEQLTVLEITLRILAAFVAGSLIGIERESKSQPAGFRTHTILCLGSALVMIISIKIGTESVHDPGRIAAQVVSGIGFLGGGAILRLGFNVRGLTTAASIWTAAAIGLAAGAGFFVEVVIGTAAVLLALSLLNVVSKRFSPRKAGQRMLSLSAMDAPGLIGMVTGILERHQIQIVNFTVNRNPMDGKVELLANVKFEKEQTLEKIISDLQSVPGLHELDFQ